MNTINLSSDNCGIPTFRCRQRVQLQQRQAELRRRGRQGQALVEFSIIALALYLLIAGVLEFGRAIYVAQGLQSAADLLAKELSRDPLPAGETFQQALNDATVQQNIFNQNLLSVDITGQDLATVVATWPIVNQQLVPLMIVQTVNGHQMLEYPGATADPSGSGGFVVYQLNDDGSVTSVPVVEEIQSGSFNIASSAHGVVGVRFNYPFHAAALSSYRYTSSSGSVSLSEAIGQNGISSSPVQSPDALQPGQAGGPYSGPNGLGQQAAMGVTVAPFSRMISAQAIYRREVFQ